MANEVQKVSVDILKVHPRNQEFFDDISGQDYENFKKSIKEEGIISEIIVAPDMTIISGRQRYKAAKEWPCATSSYHRHISAANVRRFAQGGLTPYFEYGLPLKKNIIVSYHL